MRGRPALPSRLPDPGGRAPGPGRGRAATEELDGFIINTGAVVVEIGGITEQTFEEVGAKFEVRPADPPILYRINGRDVDVSTGGWGLLISQLTRHGANLLTGIGAAREDGGLPDRELSTADWVRRYTKNEAVQGIFRNMCGSICAVGSEELPARVFLTYFTNKSAFKKFGFCPEGTIGLWKALAEVVEHNGGQVWLDSEVRRLLVEDDRVTGARVHRGDETVDVACAFAVSDIGPSATLDLVGPEHFPSDYVGAVLQRDLPCAMISVNFASREPLITAPGLLSFARTRRLCYVANFTATCPEMAPPGWHLYVGTGVPKPSVGDCDPEAETALVLQDLREEILGFEQTRILSIAVTRDDWPPQRAVATTTCRTRRRSPISGMSATRSRSTPTAASPPVRRPPRSSSTRFSPAGWAIAIPEPPGRDAQPSRAVRLGSRSTMATT